MRPVIDDLKLKFAMKRHKSKMVIYLMEAQYQMRGLIILHLMYKKTCGDVKLGKYGSNQEAATFGSSLMRLFAKMEVLG